MRHYSGYKSNLFPEGSMQLVCGGLGDLFSHLTCQDVVSFTGSASTAQALRMHSTVIANSVRFIAETMNPGAIWRMA